MRVEVPTRRSTLEQAEDGMRYTLPPRRQTSSMVFIPVWLVLWAIGFGTAIRSLLDDPLQPFLIFWLLIWTAAGVAAFYGWLSQAVGSELVTLSPGTLKIKRSVFGIEPTREYDATQIRNLRVELTVPTWYRPKRNWGAFDEGTIAFDYGAWTIRFGAGVDEAEASMIIGEIKGHYGW